MCRSWEVGGSVYQSVTEEQIDYVFGFLSYSKGTAMVRWIKRGGARDDGRWGACMEEGKPWICHLITLVAFCGLVRLFPASVIFPAQ